MYTEYQPQPSRPIVAMHQKPNKRAHITPPSLTLQSQTVSSSSPKTFHPFPLLPAEIQLMIWRFALPRSRIIQPLLDRGGHGSFFLSPNPPPQDPSILQVNQQSRSEAQRFFQPRDLSLNLTSILSPCRYISPRFDILYFDHFFDFYYGGCCIENVIARCDSVEEMLVCENVALRLRSVPYMGEEFFLWLVVWIWWFPRALGIWVVVDDEVQEWELIVVEKKVQRAAFAALGWVRQQKGGVGVRWAPPAVEVVTQSWFDRFWSEGLRENNWPVPVVPKAMERIDEGVCEAERIEGEGGGSQGRLVDLTAWLNVVMG